jgi:SAM-dependent methyltransferase
MGVRESRYDDVADWYSGFVRQWANDASPPTPVDLTGLRVLDMACGMGELSRDLAARGASVLGVDLSVRMLAYARAQAVAAHDIEYVVGDVTAVAWWDETPCDVVVCNMALMDIDDLDGALETAARVLKPGGWFSYSLLHPCFPGLVSSGSEQQLSNWPPDRGYAAEGGWTTQGDGVRGRVGATHRMLSTYVNSTIRAGFAIEELGEPAVGLVPRFLTVRCRRVG